ncbi:MAG: hypothetical protein EZS28_045642 [Streblomastix strix]|uniref:Uncharacterized protein n=1 Tax=Streblomastix strix TaxID=222440 RepID=A0A5J4TLU5_9EUKA|nr:MAG: hypothetical protein EZS28_045642 [Streblomastix strix]
MTNSSTNRGRPGFDSLRESRNTSFTSNSGEIGTMQKEVLGSRPQNYGGSSINSSSTITPSSTIHNQLNFPLSSQLSSKTSSNSGVRTPRLSVHGQNTYLSSPSQVQDKVGNKSEKSWR